MYTQRIFKVRAILGFTFIKLVILAVWSTLIVVLYKEANLEWLKIPWVPLTLIGIAVAFYMGFKNNSAYERSWEARKVWGAIVNSSRSWGIMAKDFVTNDFTKKDIAEEELVSIRKRLVYRHIAWLYRLKRQLRKLKPWEHDRKINEKYRALLNDHFPSEDPIVELQNFLSNEEAQKILLSKNGATQLVAMQSEELRLLRSRGVIDDFRHMEMEKMLTDFYTQQGKCERIKNFPLPRQYASVSVYFFYIFIALLPSGLLSAFGGMNPNMVWGVIPFTMLVGWIFHMMEIIGDYAENPFENLAFDTPMTALTRTIEIDLREMLGEVDLPPALGPVNNILM